MTHLHAFIFIHAIHLSLYQHLHSFIPVPLFPSLHPRPSDSPSVSPDYPLRPFTFPSLPCPVHPPVSSPMTLEPLTLFLPSPDLTPCNTLSPQQINKQTTGVRRLKPHLIPPSNSLPLHSPLHYSILHFSLITGPNSTSFP